MKAFNDLSTERPIGMSVGRIPWSRIIAYAERYCLERDVTEAFVDIMMTMDVAYLDYNANNKPTVVT